MKNNQKENKKRNQRENKKRKSSKNSFFLQKSKLGTMKLSDFITGFVDTNILFLNNLINGKIKETFEEKNSFFFVGLFFIFIGLIVRM